MLIIKKGPWLKFDIVRMEFIAMQNWVCLWNLQDVDASQNREWRAAY